MLNLKQIAKLTTSAFIGERLYHADLLNAIDEKLCDDIEEEYWYAAKVYHQAKNLNGCLQSIHKKLADFATGNFEAYITKHQEFAGENDSEFDPYEELRYSMNDSDSVYSLPADINQYAELVQFADKYGLRQQAQSEAFNICFPDVKHSYRSVNEFGDIEMINEDDIPQEVRDNIDINRRIAHIDVEHCLDNYNSWHQKITNSIAMRAPFSEMLTLFK